MESTNIAQDKLKAFLLELPLAQTFYGVRCLMDKNFVLLKEDCFTKTTYAVDMKEHFLVTLNRIHTCEGTKWSCDIKHFDDSLNVWTLFKPVGGDYGNPVIPEQELLQHKVDNFFNQEVIL